MTEHEKVELSGLKSGASDDVHVVSKNIVVPSEGSQEKVPVTTAQLAVTGGGGGMVAYLANTFVENQQWKSVILVLAPTIGLALMQIWAFIALEVAALWNSRKEERKRLELLKKAKQGLADAKAQLASIESDSQATPDHKKRARERVQTFERAVLELNAAGIVVID